MRTLKRFGINILIGIVGLAFGVLLPFALSLFIVMLCLFVVIGLLYEARRN